tara:strand:- start:685 stop:1002 length:318 start_codon:yes stop_codon:yes gene_type:complete
MNKLRSILFVLVGITFLYSCTSIKDGLSGRKSENSDEFLVQKKSPLALPPEFEKLPKPINEDVSDDYDTQKDEIKKLLMTSSEKNPKQKSKNQSIEEFVLEKIKD